MGEIAPPSTPENYTMFQGFEWYVPPDGGHWQRLTDVLPKLKAIGISNMWIPPACKGDNQHYGNGYDIYDLYDLGEFDQKNNGSTATKWGTKAQLLSLRDACVEQGIGLYFDAVLNHKAGADHTERCIAVEVNPYNRLEAISDPYQINCQVGFDFPGRGDTYSSLKYHWYHFTGAGWNKDNGKTAVYKIQGIGKDWSQSVAKQYGNYDYLIYADLDYGHPEVQNDVKNWGIWLAKELGIQGFRFDAAKHFSEDFLRDFINHMDTDAGTNLFYVGEFWENSLGDMTDYLQRLDHKFCLFDAPLVYKFSQISNTSSGDLRGIFDGTLVQVEPTNAVTLVQNHDTQPGQSLQGGAGITDFFKPLAYALILLRENGYPCVFYGDLYGIYGDNDNPAYPPSCSGALPGLILARKLYGYGPDQDYFDFPTCVGWVRPGTWDRPFGCAVVMSNAGDGYKRMAVGIEHRGEIWTDVLGWSQDEIKIGDDGYAEFKCGTCSVSVWVNKDAPGRDQFGKFDGTIYTKNPW